MTGAVVIDVYLARLPVRPEVAPLRSPYGTNVLASLVYPDGRTTILKVYRKEGAARNEDAALRAAAAACMVADDGAVGLIDFERARAGHWVYDTVKLFSETFGGCPDCIRAFMGGYGIDVEAIRADALVYRLVYSVDMAAYLLGELHSPQDHQLLARLLRFIRRPHDLWTDA